MKLPHLKIALVGIIATAVLMAGFVVVQANGNSPRFGEAGEKAIYIENVETLNVGGLAASQLGSSDPILGGVNTTTYDSLLLNEMLWVTGETYFDDKINLDATTTVQEISLGSRLSKALTFTAGSTTTPGGLVSLQNTGADKICQRAEINLTSQVEGSMVFDLATSTSASAYSASNANLIASTTVATGSKIFITSAVGDQVGTSGMDSFLWPNGTYILGSSDAVSTRDNATTTDYTTAAGRLYLNCHTL